MFPLRRLNVGNWLNPSSVQLTAYFLCWNCRSDVPPNPRKQLLCRHLKFWSLHKFLL